MNRSAGAAEVAESVRGWIAYANPKGASGKACDAAGGCGRPISRDGRGGMDERSLGGVR